MRQRLVPGLFPVYLNETSNNQRLTPAGYINERGPTVFTKLIGVTQATTIAVTVSLAKIVHISLAGIAGLAKGVGKSVSTVLNSSSASGRGVLNSIRVALDSSSASGRGILNSVRVALDSSSAAVRSVLNSVRVAQTETVATIYNNIGRLISILNTQEIQLVRSIKSHVVLTQAQIAAAGRDLNKIVAAASTLVISLALTHPLKIFAGLARTVAVVYSSSGSTLTAAISAWMAQAAAVRLGVGRTVSVLRDQAFDALRRAGKLLLLDSPQSTSANRGRYWLIALSQNQAASVASNLAKIVSVAQMQTWGLIRLISLRLPLAQSWAVSAVKSVGKPVGVAVMSSLRAAMTHFSQKLISVASPQVLSARRHLAHLIRLSPSIIAHLAKRKPKRIGVQQTEQAKLKRRTNKRLHVALTQARGLAREFISGATIYGVYIFVQMQQTVRRLVARTYIKSVSAAQGGSISTARTGPKLITVQQAVLTRLSLFVRRARRRLRMAATFFR